MTTTIDITNLLAFVASLVVIALSFWRTRRNPAAVLVFGALAFGGPLKALLYDLGVLHKSVLYPFSRTDLNCVFALVDVVVVSAVALIWLSRSTLHEVDIPAVVARLWPSAAVFTLIYFVFSARHVIDALAGARGLTYAGANRVTEDPIESFVNSSLMLFPASAVILGMGIRSRLLRLVAVSVFAAVSVIGTDFGRSGLVAAMVAFVLLRQGRIRLLYLAPGVAAAAVAALVIGAATRGTEEFSLMGVLLQGMADVQFLDQTISYFDRLGWNCLTPQDPAAFVLSFVYGFVPRFLYPGKPVSYGNLEVSEVLVPLQVYSREELARSGTASGFFPVSTWIEVFHDFGVPLGLFVLLLIGWLLRAALARSKDHPILLLLNLATLGCVIGFFRGGSNWIMLLAKGAVLFWCVDVALAYARRAVQGFLVIHRGRVRPDDPPPPLP